jgi:hypothetical protein
VKKYTQDDQRRTQEIEFEFAAFSFSKNIFIFAKRSLERR